MKKAKPQSELDVLQIFQTKWRLQCENTRGDNKYGEYIVVE
jgi:hypothetical protein